MDMKAAVFFALCLALIEALPPQYNNERSGNIPEQAQEDYKHHQDVLSNQNNYGSLAKYGGGFNEDGSLSVTFDNKDKNYRDRGYGYEKAYAYSRETATFDFVDDKPSLNAREIVEKYGSSDEQKDEDVFDNVAKLQV